LAALTDPMLDSAARQALRRVVIDVAEHWQARRSNQ
jgi:hypothetical protein